MNKNPDKNFEEIFEERSQLPMYMEAYTYKHITQQAERYPAGCLLEYMCLYDTPDPNKDPTKYRLLWLFILQQNWTTWITQVGL